MEFPFLILEKPNQIGIGSVLSPDCFSIYTWKYKMQDSVCEFDNNTF